MRTLGTVGPSHRWSALLCISKPGVILSLAAGVFFAGACGKNPHVSAEEHFVRARKW